MNRLKLVGWSLVVLLLAASSVHASEADLAIPDITKHGKFNIFDRWEVTAFDLLFYGSFGILGKVGISLYQLVQNHKQPGHKAVLDIADNNFPTRKTYLIKQGKLLMDLFAIIADAKT